MRYLGEPIKAIRYKGFLLIEQDNKSWLVRPERSPMQLLPFRTSTCSLLEVKKLLDLKLAETKGTIKAA